MYETKKFDEFRDYSQLLLASRIFSEYLDTRMTLLAARQLEQMNNRKVSSFPKGNIEPEHYVETWIKEHVTGGDEKWRDGVFKYFIKLLANYSSALNNGEQNE